MYLKRKSDKKADFYEYMESKEIVKALKKKNLLP